MASTVTKFAPNRFLVEGTWAVVGGKVVNEPYSRVHTTKRAAEYDASRLDEINAKALADVAEAQAHRLFVVQVYLAARKARPAPAQTEFQF